MRTALLILCFVVAPRPSPPSQKSANPAQAHPQPNAQPSKTSGGSPSPPVQPPSEKQAPAEPSNQNGAPIKARDNEHAIRVVSLPPRTRGDYIALICTVILTLVGVVGIIVAVFTLKTIAYQTRATVIAAKATHRSTVAMRKQVGIMERQTKASEDAALAAKENIEIFINKERARLRIELEDFSPIVAPALAFVLYRVIFSGSTDAFIIDAEAEAYLADALGQQSDPKMTFPAKIPEVITPTTKIEKQLCPIAPKWNLEQSDIEDILRGRAYLHFFASIEYRDVFDRERKTTFRRMWYPNITVPQVQGRWVKVGPSADNTET